MEQELVRDDASLGPEPYRAIFLQYLDSIYRFKVKVIQRNPIVQAPEMLVYSKPYMMVREDISVSIVYITVEFSTFPFSFTFEARWSSKSIMRVKLITPGTKPVGWEGLFQDDGVRSSLVLAPRLLKEFVQMISSYGIANVPAAETECCRRFSWKV